MNSLKNRNGKYSCSKIFWGTFTFLSMVGVFVMILFIIWSLATAFWNMVG
jgi:flagellar biogenesis protein FliO